MDINQKITEKLQKATKDLTDVLDACILRYLDLTAEEVQREVLEKELDFVRKVLGDLEKINGRPILYWDLDGTLLKTVGEDEDYANIIRPGAPVLLRRLKDEGYTHGLYTGKDYKLVQYGLEYPNRVNSIAHLISRDHVLNSAEKEAKMAKVKAFLSDVPDNGVLVDDLLQSADLLETGTTRQGNTCTLDRRLLIGRVIPIVRLNTSYLDDISGYVTSGNLRTTFGIGL